MTATVFLRLVAAAWVTAFRALRAAGRELVAAFTRGDW